MDILAVVTIGRSKENDVVLNNPLVSRKHAEIDIYRDGRLRLRDLSSKAGTYAHDGADFQLIGEIYVGPYDRVRFATVEMDIESCLARAGQKKYALAHAAFQSATQTLTYSSNFPPPSPSKE